jgi:threonine dehydratase
MKKIVKKYISSIENSKVYEVANISELTKAESISKEFKNIIYLKREDLQPTHSFKIRGAYNKIAHLFADKKVQEVATASAGNHAQGVAYSAKALGINATIFMPKTTPAIKVNAVKSLKAKVILVGNNFDDALKASKIFCKERKISFIHPFDDPLVIAGQGTVGMEIVNQFPEKLYAIFVAVGGGGLIAGIGSYLKAKLPNVKIIGVEAEDSAGLNASMKAGKRIKLKEVGLFADGAAAKQIGKHNYDLITEILDDSITVNTDEICAAVKDTFIETRTVPEPTGALALAGLKKYIKQKGIKKKNLIATYCGSNLNFESLSHIVERSKIGEKKEIILGINIPEKKGSFKKLCKDIGLKNITEFSYRKDLSSSAKILLGIELQEKRKAKEMFLKSLRSKKYILSDLSNDEIAKKHLKFMNGGRGPKLESGLIEEVYNVDFPEKPGALLEFLTMLKDKWDISLFHYKNQGAIYGGALVGFTIKEGEHKKLERDLLRISYPFARETDNFGYRAFLK